MNFNKICKKCGCEFSSTSRNKQLCTECSTYVVKGRKSSFTCNMFEGDIEGYSYFMGFGFADGYYAKNKDNLYVMSTDIDIIEKLHSRLEYTGPIHSYENKKGFKTIYQFNLASNLARYFKDKGFLNDKEELEVPNDVDIYAFLRGFLDGDGWISVQHRKNYDVFVLGVCGRYKLLKQLQEIFGGRLSKNRNIWHLNWGLEQSRDLAKRLYEDATIYLDRKYAIYKNLI